MSLEEAIQRFHPSQQFILDLLIWEVRAAMPCYTQEDLCIWATFDGSGGLEPWSEACPTCKARAELERLNKPIPGT